MNWLGGRVAPAEENEECGATQLVVFVMHSLGKVILDIHTVLEGDIPLLI